MNFVFYIGFHGENGALEVLEVGITDYSHVFVRGLTEMGLSEGDVDSNGDNQLGTRERVEIIRSDKTLYR